jgi:phosphoglycolate phosphatase
MPERPERPPVIVFDLDGTLVDTAPDLVAALNAVAAGALPPITLAEGKRYVGHGIRAMVERAFAAHGKALAPANLDQLTEAFLAYYADHLVDQSRTYPGLDVALDRFTRAGWRPAVCTNKVERIARRLLELLGLAERFAAIAGSDTFGVRKPDPRHLTLTIHLAGGEPGRAVMVGDSMIDRATAAAAGVPFVGVSFGYDALRRDHLAGGAIIDDFAGLWRVVERIGGEPAAV